MKKEKDIEELLDEYMSLPYTMNIFPDNEGSLQPFF